MNVGWISEEGQEVTKQDLLHLYDVFYENQGVQLNLHLSYAKYYSTLFTVLVTGYIAGVIQYFANPLSFGLLLIPCLVLVLAELGKRGVDRHYQRFLEAITMAAKIENLLGWDSPVKAVGGLIPKRKVWKDDEGLTNMRWVKGRFGPGPWRMTSEHQSSAQWIEGLKYKGANQIVHWTFTLFQVLAGLSFLAGLLLLGKVHHVPGFDFVPTVLQLPLR